MSIFFIKESFALHNNQSWALSPALFPLIITVLTLMFSIALIVKGIKASNVERELDNIDNWKQFLLIILLSLIYLIILPKIHFLLSTIIYLFFFLWILGERKWWLLAAMSIATPLLIQYLFGNLLDVLLP